MNSGQEFSSRHWRRSADNFCFSAMLLSIMARPLSAESVTGSGKLNGACSSTDFISGPWQIPQSIQSLTLQSCAENDDQDDDEEEDDEEEEDDDDDEDDEEEDDDEEDDEEEEEEDEEEDDDEEDEEEDDDEEED